MVKTKVKQNLEEGINSVKWLVEEKLKLTPEKASEVLQTKDFKKYNLESMLQEVFDHSIYRALTTTYPNHFSEEDYSKRYRGSYKGKWEDKPEKVKAAVRDLFENQLKIPIEDIPQKVSAKLFLDNGLATVFCLVFGSSTYRAIQAVYPKRFKPWEFKNKPRGIWKGEKGYKNAVKAIRWLIEKKLKIPIDKAPEILTYDIFKEYGLQTVLYKFSKGSGRGGIKGKSIIRALANAYPHKFSVEDKKKVGIQVNENEIKGIIEELEPAIYGIAKKQYIKGGKDELGDLIQYGKLGVLKVLEERGLKKQI